MTADGNQVFDDRGRIVVLRTWPVAARAGLTEVFWHLEGVADGPPDDLGIHSVRERPLDRAPAELAEYEVLGHALRVHLAELRIHPVPEFRQPHVAQGTAARDQTCTADKPAFAGAGDPGDLSPDVSLLNTWVVLGEGRTS